MAKLEFELDHGNAASASDFFQAGTELIRSLDGLTDVPVSWTIVDLRMGSALATLSGDEEHAEVADQALVSLVTGLQMVRTGGRSESWNPEVVQGMKAFVHAVGPGDDRSRATLRLIQDGRATETLPVDRPIVDGLSAWKPVDRRFQGSTVGRIVGVNVARGNRASLRPKSGRVVHLRFGDELAGAMKDALYADVEVFGTLRRDERDRVFHASVERIAVLDSEPALSWAAVFGLDPDFTGGLPADRYLEESRGEA